ncbi:helix-turn-helix domain-containing protein [Prosthecomicrobium pneumaticum]|uniref:HTH cro/C1-type domain-containing protein n=1 Tax=Prosthecomicrobium pneumaticum TaxID=81895 RepID=A0A7W9FR26_9HYPH|nr:hypothetical protein [Prosthecomicrobium pneumaticum]
MTEEKKLFLGPRLRRMRRELGLSQTDMAGGLGVSPSYVNLMERNQRPVTAQMMLRLAEVYDVDIRALAPADDDRIRGEIEEALADPLFRDLAIPVQEARDLIEQTPAVADALARLYAAYRQATRDRPDTTVAAERGFAFDPIERVRSAIEAAHNHFAELDAEGAALAADLAADPGDTLAALGRRLAERHGIRLRVLPAEIMTDGLRRFDRHRRHLLLSELLTPSGRVFEAALQTGLIEHSALIDRTVAAALGGEADPLVVRLLRRSLASYFAGATMMPYDRFLDAAEAVRYDLLLLARRFGVGLEQVCHRLTTLQRPSRRGVPFFMIRIDEAGNVSKRYAAGRVPLARQGGGCALWTLHAAFRSPDVPLTQRLALPDGGEFLSVALMLPPAALPFPARPGRFAVALVAEAKYAARIVYADGLGSATPIGIACRLCERADCAQRAEPPANRPLILDENTRRIAPFRFDARR